ncbi:MAG: Lrp/AsnC family transcriptional regulator [Nitrososphaerales archaeon]
MAIAFILLNVKMGSEDQALKEVESLPEVKEAYRVYGTYDTIVKVESADFAKVRNVIDRIRGIKEIRSTLTLIVNG